MCELFENYFSVKRNVVKKQKIVVNVHFSLLNIGIKKKRKCEGDRVHVIMQLIMRFKCMQITTNNKEHCTVPNDILY